MSNVGVGGNLTSFFQYVKNIPQFYNKTKVRRVVLDLDQFFH